MMRHEEFEPGGTAAVGDARSVMDAAGCEVPAEASDPADFVQAMRRLKAWSGLSYRDLERRAEENGDVLPRSTLEDALGRGRLPRVRLVAAFARACGCTEDEIADWVRVRRRLAVDAIR